MLTKSSLAESTSLIFSTRFTQNTWATSCSMQQMKDSQAKVKKIKNMQSGLQMHGYPNYRGCHSYLVSDILPIDLPNIIL